MANNKMLIGFFVASESIFFIMLILAYVSFKGTVVDGPTAASSLNPYVTGVFSIFLLASSFTISASMASRTKRASITVETTIFRTIVPRCGRTSSNPSSASFMKASRTGWRLTEKCAAISDSEMRQPGSRSIRIMRSRKIR